MVAPSTSGLRQALAAVLILVLTLAGAGRGFAAAPDAAGPALAGLNAPICHSGGDPRGPGDPAAPAGDGCCDACALMAPAILPAPAALSGPAPAVQCASHARAPSWMPAAARARSPRQSQGPPAA